MQINAIILHWKKAKKRSVHKFRRDDIFWNNFDPWLVESRNMERTEGQLCILLTTCTRVSWDRNYSRGGVARASDVCIFCFSQCCQIISHNDGICLLFQQHENSSCFWATFPILCSLKILLFTKLILKISHQTQRYEENVTVLCLTCNIWENPHSWNPSLLCPGFFLIPRCPLCYNFHVLR